MVKPSKFVFSSILGRALGIFAVVALASCQNEERLGVNAITDAYAQNFNPPYIEVLWVMSDRSPMYEARAHIIDQASQFFRRLDQSSNEYVMGVITADMVKGKGQIQPLDAPLLLNKKTGTLEQRVANFSAILNRSINLYTGALDKGFESSLTSLKQYFPTRRNVPLVLIYLTDSDDVSSKPSGEDAVSYYANQLIALKDKRELVKVYSVNYLPLAAGETPNPTNRCATTYTADIDNSPTFENRYFRLSQFFSSGPLNLCGSFASTVDLTGLRLNELVKSFPLTQVPDVSTISVKVTKDGSLLPELAWSYNASANTVVFSPEAPPEGALVSVTYLSAN